MNEQAQDLISEGPQRNGKAGEGQTGLEPMGKILGSFFLILKKKVGAEGRTYNLTYMVSLPTFIIKDYKI